MNSPRDACVAYEVMASRRRIKQKPKAVRGGGQLTLGLFAGTSEGSEAEAREERQVVFNDPDPRRLCVGEQRLEEFLSETGLAEVFTLREILRSLDLSSILEKYRPGGRSPYHPAGVLGLIMLGIMEGKSSLRELELLGRSDVRSWWLTGGVMPNYSVICRFINTNAQVLTTEFFEQLTQSILKGTSSGAASVAVDGTVIQAATSRYKTIKREAAERAAMEARERADQSPDDASLEQKAKQAEHVAKVAQERAEAREQRGRKSEDTKVCPTEPDAVVQPRKNKAMAPSYKGSVAANDDRIITAHAVHPTSETEVIPALVEQTERASGERVSEMLEDAGYHSSSVLKHALEHDINLLCPSGRTDTGDESWEKQSKKMFLKNRFRYDEEDDSYICPAGQRLEREYVYSGNEQNPGYVQYRCLVCEACSLRTRCTKSKRRGVRRYADDELKEVMREVMKQPGARQRYRQRQAMVEPVHGEHRCIQKLARFRRRGLVKVRLEYSLHCCAHNLRRYTRLLGRHGGTRKTTSNSRSGPTTSIPKVIRIIHELLALGTPMPGVALEAA